jgi:hypothetical protein
VRTVRTEGRGRVATFDVEVGLGEVEADDGRRYPFPCVAVADGSRQIDVGAPVAFTIRPGLPGRWEAFDIRPAPTLPAPGP